MAEEEIVEGEDIDDAEAEKDLPGKEHENARNLNRLIRKEQIAIKKVQDDYEALPDEEKPAREGPAALGALEKALSETSKSTTPTTPEEPAPTIQPVP